MGPLEHKEEGNRLFGQREWRRAAEEYTKGLGGAGTELPGDQRGLLLSNRSQCMLNLEDWESALADADAGLRLLPEHAKSYFRRAVAREKLGRAQEALDDYVRVVKLDPKNQGSVAAARRLREEVLESGQRKRDEVAPGRLLEVLRGDGEPEAKVDACGKLRALCVHRGLAGSLLSLGVVELLVERAADPETATEVRRAMLHVLVAVASGHEAQDDDAPRVAPPAAGPLPVPPAAAEARGRVRARLPLAGLRPLCRADGGSARHLAMLVGTTHEPEDVEAVEAIHDALAFPEEGEVNVPRAGVAALSGMLDIRRRKGKSAQCLMPSAPLLKCVETALGTTTCDEQLRPLLALFWALLADKEDRPKSMEFDLTDVSLRVLEPFLGSEDWALKANGLSGLSALLAASSQSATELLTKSSAPLVAILTAIKRPPAGAEGAAARDHAVECMLLCAGDRKTRQHFVDGEGIEILLSILADGEEGSGGIVRAKMIAVLAIVAGHNKEVREEVFDRMDFLLELRHALDVARESAATARSSGAAAGTDEVRRLCRALYESCACLSIHGEFKELLMGSKKTLRAMLDLAGAEDLAEDKHLAFLYASLAYNLCRSREDKVRPKRDQFPLSELGEDDLGALEEFYEKMPAEARPVKNGEVDAGSVELAGRFRTWCVQGDGGSASPASGVVKYLAKCASAGSSSRVRGLVASVLKLLCAEQAHRRLVVSAGGVRALLGLVDLEDETARDNARQALAQLLIVTNPALLQYSEQLDSVRPMVDMMQHRHELLQFEAAMGLTNLLVVGDELRSRALQADAWQVCRDLLFSENEMVQRAGLEAMCNLSMAPEVVERFATGKADLELKVFCSFCHSEDRAMRVAASGALATLASCCEEVAAALGRNESFGHLLESLARGADADVQHRATVAVSAVCVAEGSPAEAVAAARAALRERLARGFVSQEAEGIAKAVFEEAAPRAAGGG